MDSPSSSTLTLLSPEPSKPRIKAPSAPIVPYNVHELPVKISKQISAPSYFNCLKEGEGPHFKVPVKEPVPKLLIGSIVNEVDVVEMIAAAGADAEKGLEKFLGTFLVKKQIIHNFDLSEKKFLISLLKETIEYAAQRDFSDKKLSVLLTIYLDTHCYFKWYYWQAPTAVWNYFKEIMIRHTVEDSPEGQEIFEPEECYDVITHFHTMYISNLPLIHILTFGTQRIKFTWPYKSK